MWNFTFEIPTLLVLFIILVFFFSRPRLSIKRNLVFVKIILLDTLTVIFDIIASYACNHYTMVPEVLLSWLNMMFFICFFVRSLYLYLFILVVLRIQYDRRNILQKLIILPCIIGCVLTVISPFARIVYYTDKLGYHEGSHYDLIFYGLSFFYVIVAFIVLFIYRNRFNRKREFLCMLMYNVVLTAGLVTRLLMPLHLIMDTFVLMAIIIVYLAFENPEYYLDLRSTVFNATALREYLEENIGRLNQAFFGIVVHNYHEIRDIYGTQQMDTGLNLIGRYLKQTFPNGKVFYYRRGRYIVLADKNTDLEEKQRMISARFERSWKSDEVEVYLTAGFIKADIDKKYSADVILNTVGRKFEVAGMIGSEDILQVSEEDFSKIESEMSVKRSVETAVENNGIEVFLQPIVDAYTGKLVGAEALSRIRDEEGKIIPPGVFIPLAEKGGWINELGEQVFEKTCLFIRQHDLKSMGVSWVNVNLSPVQFLRTNLANRYSVIVNKYGIDPDVIHLEITEESMIDDNFLQKQIKNMGEKGFMFVLDDYGTGYSNITRLKKCPFINVKLDMSLVWDYCKDPGEILPNMLQTFKHMKFEITAEGIEDENMAKAMRDIGCDYLQGYLYSKPVPIDEFVKKYKNA